MLHQCGWKYRFLRPERPQLQRLGQKTVKPQSPLPLGGGSEHRDLHLDHLVPPGPVKAFLNGGTLLPGAAGYLLRIFLHKGCHPMHMAVKPSAAVFVHKAGEFRMKVPKITTELPRLPGRDFFAVRRTAPGAQAPLGIVDAFPGRFDWAAILIMKQKSSCQGGQHPVEPLKVQNSVECEPAQIGGVLLVPGGVVYCTGVVLKFLPLIQHAPPPAHVPQCGPAADPTAGSAYPEPPHRVPPGWAGRSCPAACGRPWTPRPAHCR